MKFFTAQFLSVFRSRSRQRNVRLLLGYLLAFLLLLVVYSLVFHWLMLREGQAHSWLTGFYWTLTVMSTLGFGDITFQSDLGRAFSMGVLLSGMIFLLVIMPFTFIEFFYGPYMKAQAEARAPRSLPANVRGHAILTHFDPVTSALIQKLDQYGLPYALVTPDLPRALELHDLGYSVLVGAPDLPETYQRLRIQEAALVAATGADMMNTNVTFTVREISPSIPVITTATSSSAEDILKLAGSSRVLRLDEIMGQSLARRTIGGDARAHVIGRFDDLLIAEATAAGTPLIGKTLAESGLRETLGMNVVGIWQRGRFDTPTPETRIEPQTVLVLAGSQEQLRHYDQLFCIYNLAAAPAIIVGAGRVGLATARALKRRNLEYQIVEQNPTESRTEDRVLSGNAADIDTLEQAGIQQAPAVILTARDDDTNIYLTILCRRLRPNIQIISRATFERNVSTLHRAGADFVMSYASMGANAIFNLLRRADVLMLAEGLNVFRLRVPPALENKAIAETSIRTQTGCSVVAVGIGPNLTINPDPGVRLEPGTEIVLIGTVENENRFLRKYGQD